MQSTLPEGMVTLLFTDMEASTAIASDLGEEAAQVVRRRHFALVREQVERYRGREVKTMGDGFMVAFTSTRRAVQCAVEIQRAVERERERNAATPRVRVGINAGEVVQDEEDLFGLMVNAAARIQARAAGGQVLVSESVKMLLGPASGIEFIDVGEHELKGFTELWRLFEVPCEIGSGRASPQGIFVGRQPELDHLQRYLDAALEGRGSVVAVVGEPGIGKTRLVREFADFATRRAVQVHWGTTHESAGAPAFWPWVRAIRALNSAIDIEPLQSYIEEKAEELVRLFPEVRTVVLDLPGLGDLPTSEGESAQFRLFDAITGYLKKAAEIQPLVIVLDDLHWADKSTLLLLQYIASELGDSRILIVGTYRDVEVGRQHPLEATLAHLHRTSRFHVVDLKGLDESHVRDYINRASGARSSAELVAEIVAQIDGNPFFLGEVVALMAREGTLTAGGAVTIPQSVRAVVGQRLNKLSEDCNELLRIASVAGRQFRLDVLAEVSGKDEDTVLDFLDEAVDARVVDESVRIGEYQFHHALMQETLLDELSTNRRVRLHARVADALEHRDGDIPDRAAGLAFHFGEAVLVGKEYARKAVSYFVTAAEHAESHFAWGEAARLYERALSIGTDEPDALAGRDIGYLYLALSRSAQCGAEYRTAWKAIQVAAVLFTERRDARAFGAIGTQLVAGGVWYPTRTAVEIVSSGLEFAGDDPALQIPILAALVSGTLGSAQSRAKVDKYLAGLRAAVEATGDQRGKTFIRLREGLNHLIDSQFQEAVAKFTDSPSPTEATPLVWGLTMAGMLDKAESVLGERLQRAREERSQFLRENLAAYLANLALLRGRRELYETLAAAESASASYVWAACRSFDSLVTGRIDDALAQLPDVDLLKGIGQQPWQARAFRAGVRWAAGRHPDAASEWRRALADADAHDPEMSSDFTNVFHWGWVVGYLDEAGPALVETNQALLIRGNFRDGGIWEDFFVAPNPPICMLRLGAHWLVTGGEVEAGKARYQRSLNWCREQKLPLEEGRSLLGLAEVAELEGDLATAREYLGQARRVFERIDARYFVGRVDSREGRLS